MNLLRKILKLVKYGLRGGATIFLPLITIPLLGGLFGMAIQCGLLFRIPLLIIWIQTIFAWIDDIIRWVT